MCRVMCICMAPAVPLREDETPHCQCSSVRKVMGFRFDALLGMSLEAPEWPAIAIIQNLDDLPVQILRNFASHVPSPCTIVTATPSPTSVPNQE